MSRVWQPALCYDCWDIEHLDRRVPVERKRDRGAQESLLPVRPIHTVRNLCPGRARELPTLPAMTNVPIAAIDCETTGVHWRKQIWEAAVIRREPDGEEREIAFYLDVDLRDADGIGLSIGRFYDRHPLGRHIAGLLPDTATPPHIFTRKQAALKIAEWTHGAHMIGNVTSFDTIAFERLMRRQSLTPSWHYHLIDVENVAVGYLKGLAKGVSPSTGRLPTVGAEVLSQLPWDSDALSELLGVKPPSDEERHTALGDARWALAMWDAVMG